MKHGHGANAQPRANRTRDSFPTTMIRAYTLIRGPGANVTRAAFRLLPWLGGRPEELTRVERASRAAASDLDGFLPMSGSSGGWARTEYGKYCATSVPVYAAIKVRSDALSRAPAVVYRTNSAGERTPVGPSHPAQHLLDRVNRWYTKPDLWRTTETCLNLWGSVFWAIERDEEGRREIWPLRPDRLTIIPDKKKHIRGFVYNGRSGQVAYTPEEMVWFRYFNPLEEYAGLSPIAPAHMAVDMGKD